VDLWKSLEDSEVRRRSGCMEKLSLCIPVSRSLKVIKVTRTDWVPVTSYQSYLLTFGLSRTISEINSNFCLKCKFFLPLHLTPVLSTLQTYKPHLGSTMARQNSEKFLTICTTILKQVDGEAEIPYQYHVAV